ncbi:hypothetical protein RFI_26686 [Reticulomyxa filosa]|uniref:Acyl-CoA oxidase C-terminal domain-containing protein n=1 Tax=Reticulomyxa filosa TaxID=46433 RepID=X6MB42_RETFI|nr:hypothetical protein RFI_26686 [Reticulomyxa filosa]|eukprot:ETO10692.1 hypothetical protein RFI_26686 [Reticulomyxa filosa]
MLSSTITFAHAGMTAEGDNSVLYQKVSKELLDRMRQKKHVFNDKEIKEHLQKLNWNDPSSLQYLFLALEKLCLETLGMKLMTAVGGNNDKLFHVWMKEQSDWIQSSASAYANRVTTRLCCVDFCILSPSPKLTQITMLYIVFEASLKVLKQVQDDYLRTVIEKSILLAQLAAIEKNIGKLVSYSLISTKDGQNLGDHINKLCKFLAPKCLSICQAFGIPEERFPPIARDWVEYNKWDNQGEIYTHHPLTS